MSEDQLLRLRRAPEVIERGLPHLVWCDSFDNRLRIQAGVSTNTTTEGEK